MKEIERIPPLQKTTMSVPEMRDLLGICKVEAYWLVKKNYFPTVLIAGRMRIVLADFEDWYAGQLHYKKVNGPAPGSKWGTDTMSVAEASQKIAYSRQVVRDLAKRNLFRHFRVDGQIWIDVASFEKWYSGQTHYRRNNDLGGT